VSRLQFAPSRGTWFPPLLVWQRNQPETHSRALTAFLCADLLEATNDLPAHMSFDVSRWTVSPMYPYGSDSNVLLWKEHVY